MNHFDLKARPFASFPIHPEISEWICIREKGRRSLTSFDSGENNVIYCCLYHQFSTFIHIVANRGVSLSFSIGKYLWFWDIRSYPISQSALGYNIISHILKKCPDIYLYYIYIHIFVEQKYLGNIWKISSEYLKISWDLRTLIIVTDEDKGTILEITLHVFSYFGW